MKEAVLMLLVALLVVYLLNNQAENYVRTKYGVSLYDSLQTLGLFNLKKAVTG
jgi:hypothetical protein